MNASKEAHCWAAVTVFPFLSVYGANVISLWSLGMYMRSFPPLPSLFTSPEYVNEYRFPPAPAKVLPSATSKKTPKLVARCSDQTWRRVAVPMILCLSPNSEKLSSGLLGRSEERRVGKEGRS